MSVHKSMQHFKRMHVGLKCVFFGAVCAGMFTFLPWFQMDELTTTEGLQLIRTPVVRSGFGAFPVFGMLSMSFAIAALFLFLRNETGGKTTFGVSNARLWMMIAGEAIFTLCIALAVFASQVRVDSTAHIRFGLFASLFAYTLLFFGGYILEKDLQKQKARESFAPIFSEQISHEEVDSSPVSDNQLSFSDTAHEREQSILR